MRRGLLVLAAAVAFAGSMASVAQVPTAEQLELLRSMSPEDREALMEQLGLGGSVLGDTVTDPSSGDSTMGGRNRASRGTDERSPLDRAALAERLVAEQALKPEDSLLIDV